MKVASRHQLQQLEHARRACDLILINVRRAREFLPTGEELDALERVARDTMVALITLKTALQEEEGYSQATTGEFEHCCIRCGAKWSGENAPDCDGRSCVPFFDHDPDAAEEAGLTK